MVELLEDGTLTYVPNPGYLGLDYWEDMVNDGTNEGSAVGAVVIDIRNTAPVALLDEYTTGAGLPITIRPQDWLANDFDIDGDTLSLMSYDLPVHGEWRDLGGGLYEYRPDAGYVGEELLSYTVSDGVESTTGQVIIKVSQGEGMTLVARDDAFDTPGFSIWDLRRIGVFERLDPIIPRHPVTGLPEALPPLERLTHVDFRMNFEMFLV